MSEAGRPEEQRQELPLEEVERLVEIVRESGVGEINIRQGSLRITVKAMPSVPSHPTSQPVVASQVAERVRGSGGYGPNRRGAGWAARDPLSRGRDFLPGARAG